MKKIFLSLFVLLSCFLQVNAQNFVSTEPQKKGVLVEEFTGRNCQYCPDGQLIANSIHNSYPDRAFVVAIHAGGLSPYTKPNLNTTIGDALDAAFDGSSRPSAVINRSTAEEQIRTAWSALAGEELNKDALVNIDGLVVIDEASRMATIIVEAYYTADTSFSSNYINVYMVQDSILGYQNGADKNPSQIVNGTYCHMHVLRSSVTPTWGDEVTSVSKGTLIEKVYTYQIPATIGSSNAVDVDIDNVHFLAFLTEKYQGVPTRPILNVNQLKKVQGNFGAVTPLILDAKQESKVSCSSENSFSAKVLNVGSSSLQSFTMEVRVDNQVVDEYTWEGTLEQYETALVEFDIDMTPGEHEVTFEIKEANSVSVSDSKTINAFVKESVTVQTNEDNMTLTIDVTQDKYGNQITWEIIKSDMSVIASGGPYDLLTGSSATKLHRVQVEVPSDECLRFIIRDSEGNGICCNYGEGSYKIKGNNTIIVDGDGAFGAEADHNLNIVKTTDVNENVKQSYNIYPNPVKNTLNIKGENMSQIMIYNSLGQVVKSVSCDSDNMTIDVNSLEDGMYFINIINNNGEVRTSKISVMR